MSRLPPSERDRDGRRKMLLLLVEILDASQEDVARLVGVTQGLVSYWLKGERVVDWAVVHRLTERAIAWAPDREGEILAALLEHQTGRKGRFTPDEDLGARDFHEEAADLSIEVGDLHRAVREGDEAGVERVAQRIQRELEEAIAGARQAVQQQLERGQA